MTWSSQNSSTANGGVTSRAGLCRMAALGKPFRFIGLTVLADQRPIFGPPPFSATNPGPSASGKSRPVAVLGDRQVSGSQKCKDSRLRALVFDDLLLQITRVSEWERAPDYIPPPQRYCQATPYSL